MLLYNMFDNRKKNENKKDADRYCSEVVIEKKNSRLSFLMSEGITLD